MCKRQSKEKHKVYTIFFTKQFLNHTVSHNIYDRKS